MHSRAKNALLEETMGAEGTDYLKNQEKSHNGGDFSAPRCPPGHTLPHTWHIASYQQTCIDC